jgi:putative ABC transport system permease protein
MSIAITAAFHMYFFAYKELSTDSFHSKKKEVYRVLRENNKTNLRSSANFLPLGALLKDKIPEVIEYSRIIPTKPHTVYNKVSQSIKELSFVDPSFFNLFDFKLVSGTYKEFKETPNGVLISEKTAKNLFKENENPIGKIIEFSKYKDPNKWQLQITGVLKNIPETSTIQGNYFVNFSLHEKMLGKDKEKYKWNFLDTDLYIHAPKGTNLELLTQKMTSVLLNEVNSNREKYKLTKEYHQFDLQRLDTLYFTSSDIRDQKKKGSMQFVNIIILIAILTLFLATTNYIIMNLGLNLHRSKELRLRRTLGASKKTLFLQLSVESIINSLICFAITIVSYPLIGEFIAELISFNYQLTYLEDSVLLFYFLGIILLIGIIIGTMEYLLSYKFIFNNSKPVKTKRFFEPKRTIIVFQLLLFITLTSCILLIGKQVNYIQNKNLGFDPESVMSFVYMKNSSTALKNEIEKQSYVKAVTDGNTLFTEEIRLVDVLLTETKDTVPSMLIQGNADYLKVHNLELLYGKNLNPSKLPSLKNFWDMKRMSNKGIIEVLVNEEFVKRANLKNPIGTILDSHADAVIVGVFKNVLNTPLYYPVQPIVLGYDFSFKANLFQVSFEKAHKKELLTLVRKFYIDKGFEPIIDMLVREKDYSDVYKKEFQLKKLLEAFTVIVLFISLLGMIAISLFITESKTKEIGIRKVNGATIKEIILMLNKDFLKWIGISFVIACPIAYYLMSLWLENFAYKTALSWWVFALAGIFTLLIALITVSWQTYKAATQNPVKSLRDE